MGTIVAWICRSSSCLRPSGLCFCASLAVLMITASGGVAAAADDAAFAPLFDGRTLAGWEGDPEIWSVRDGAIVGETTPDKQIKTNTFLIWSQGNVDDVHALMSRGRPRSKSACGTT